MTESAQKIDSNSVPTQKYPNHRVVIDFGLFAGDILVFNNGRVMHAREAFDTRQARELEGVYADWDYLLSAWRVAKVRMNQQG